MPVKYLPGSTTVRGRPFAQAVSLLSESTFNDWPVDGPRTLLWLLRTMAAGDTTPNRRHYWWRSVLGLGANEAGVGEHAFLSELLENGVCFDQLNCSELAVYEHISRRYQVLEESYRGRLQDKTMGTESTYGLAEDELSLYVGKRSSTTTALVCPALQTFVAAGVAEKTAILKERRKGREERGLAASPHVGQAGGGDAQKGNKGHKGGPKAKAKPE